MGTFLIILILLFSLWPLIVRWLRPMIQRYMARKAEDYLRRAAGMPPRSDSRARSRSDFSSGNRASRSRGRHHDPSREPIIPSGYAEDVEFVEVRDFSSDTVIAESDHPKSAGKSIRVESQVSDAEYVMITEPKKRRS